MASWDPMLGSYLSGGQQNIVATSSSLESPPGFSEGSMVTMNMDDCETNTLTMTP